MNDWKFKSAVHTGILDMETHQEHAAGAMGQRSAINILLATLPGSSISTDG